MRKSILLRALVAAVGSFVGLQSAFGAGVANYVFDNTDSSVSITQIADVSNPSTNFFLPGATNAQLTQSITGLETYASVPGTSILQSNSGLQLNNTFVAGSSRSTGAGGIYQITNNNNLSLGLAAGSGAAQTNNGSYTGASAVDIHVTAEWHLNQPLQVPGFYPGISYQFPVAGFVGTNGNDHFIVSLNLTDSAFTGSVGNINIDQDYNNVGGLSPLVINQNLSGVVLLNHGVALPAGSNFTVSGDIVFKSKDPGSPSDFHLGDVNGVTGDDSSGTDATFGIINSTDANLPDPAPLPASLVMGAAGIALVVIAARRSTRRVNAI